MAAITGHFRFRMPIWMDVYFHNNFLSTEIISQILAFCYKYVILSTKEIMAQRIEDETYSLLVIKERAARVKVVWDELKVQLGKNILKPLFEEFLKDGNNFRDGRGFSLAWFQKDGEIVSVPIEDEKDFLRLFVSEPVFKEIYHRIYGEKTDWRQLEVAIGKFHHKILSETMFEDMVLEEITVDTENGTKKIDDILRVKFSGNGLEKS